MNVQRDITPSSKHNSDRPLLQINRLVYVKSSTRILDATDQKLKQYLRFASHTMNTEVTSDDVIEFALTHLFERDTAFKSWIKINL